jgi:hypothetical protein
MGQNGVSNAFSYSSSGNPTQLRGVAHAYNSGNQLTDAGFSYDGKEIQLLTMARICYSMLKIA